ncbi:hypothetical protein VPNG_05829 [Cytospora leucostoma]|uniref:Ca3427-like PBP 2 domain-containing protein n=1 Tax=Cytospora leucostoma TaxID=1230097 RepID=A0A423X0S3_9PEZI|nr:hypothetical protein VPNG_05829 [Cytospora leucostoma]
MASTSAPLRVGYVPEHFSTPIYFAKKHFGLDAELIAFPSGTGHMITALRAGEIDVGIGLTEGWVAGLGKEEQGAGGYQLVGTYVETPLCAKRPEITGVDSLNGGKIGISRLGSGSYVMGFVLADEQGWLSNKTENSSSSSPYSDFVILNNFENLRKAVNSGEADFFMWEHFTSKRYYDSGEIRRVGEIYTPWSSWKIVASTGLVQDGQLDARLNSLFEKLDQGIKHFNENKEEAVKYISTELDYSEEDAREWLKTVRFPAHTEGVDLAVVEKTVGVLRKAGVLVAGKGAEPVAMIAKQR